MNNRDFYYWLQGYFELKKKENPLNTLADAGWQLSKQQADVIIRHLELIKESGNELDDFTNWLEGVMDVWLKSELIFKHTITAMIMKKLEGKFEHIAKPPVKIVKIDLNKLRRGIKPRLKPNRMTC